MDWYYGFAFKMDLNLVLCIQISSSQLLFVLVYEWKGWKNFGRKNETFMLMAFLTCQKSNFSKLESKWWILIYFLSWQILRNTVPKCFPAVWSKGFSPRWDYGWGFQKCIINSKHFKKEAKIHFDRLVHDIFPLCTPILLNTTCHFLRCLWEITLSCWSSWN